MFLTYVGGPRWEQGQLKTQIFYTMRFREPLNSICFIVVARQSKETKCVNRIHTRIVTHVCVKRIVSCSSVGGSLYYRAVTAICLEWDHCPGFRYSSTLRQDGVYMQA